MRFSPLNSIPLYYFNVLWYILLFILIQSNSSIFTFTAICVCLCACLTAGVCVPWCAARVKASGPLSGVGSCLPPGWAGLCCFCSCAAYCRLAGPQTSREHYSLHLVLALQTHTVRDHTYSSMWALIPPSPIEPSMYLAPKSLLKYNCVYLWNKMWLFLVVKINCTKYWALLWYFNICIWLTTVMFIFLWSSPAPSFPHDPLFYFW